MLGAEPGAHPRAVDVLRPRVDPPASARPRPTPTAARSRACTRRRSRATRRVTMTFSCRDHESSVQFVDPAQTASPSRTTNLWCMRSGTPAIRACLDRERLDRLGRGLRRRRHRDRPRVGDVVERGGRRRRAAPPRAGMRARAPPRRSRSGRRRARCRASSARVRGTRDAARDVGGALAAVGQRRRASIGAGGEPDVTPVGGCGAERGLVRALRRLVLREVLGRVDLRRDTGSSGTSSCAASTPKWSASTEPKPVIFIFPKPGSAPIRLRRSAASAASVQIRSASPPYSSATTWQSSCTRSRHRAREAVDRRALAERRLERLRDPSPRSRARRACRSAASA